MLGGYDLHKNILRLLICGYYNTGMKFMKDKNADIMFHFFDLK